MGSEKHTRNVLHLAPVRDPYLLRQIGGGLALSAATDEVTLIYSFEDTAAEAT